MPHCTRRRPAQTLDIDARNDNNVLSSPHVADMNGGQWGHGRGGRPWQRLRRRLLRHAHCAHCGATTALELDHIVPLAAGGTNHPTNLQALCHTCHLAKTAHEAARARTPRRRPPDRHPGLTREPEA